ncbi:MAG: GTP 3',8-cyclase MoaA [Acidobacteriota bacterium]
MSDPVRDQSSRPLRELRVSVTDRCNFRCGYCMPREVFGEGYEFLPRRAILRFEEIQRVVRIFVELGVRKVRVTGGEPLLRHDLPQLVAMLAEIEGIELALTTNGALLPKYARELADAGMHRVTVSLDSLDDAVFRRMNDADFPVARVLEGIAAAEAAGMAPIKVNCMVQRGVNDHTLVELARHFKSTGHVVRFIEFMDVGTTNEWHAEDVVSGAEIVERITAEFPADPVEPAYRGEVAKRWRYRDGSGEFGVITSVTRPFCGDCTRARLSAEGVVYTCLFAHQGTDLRETLRGGHSDDRLREVISGLWTARTDRYSELRAAGKTPPKIEMSYIGG